MTPTVQWKDVNNDNLGKAYATALFFNGLVYIGSGETPGYFLSSSINVYDPNNDKWSKSLEVNRYRFTLAVLNKLIIFGGGSDDDVGFKTIDTIAELDNDRFINTIMMKTGRAYATAVGHNGMLIVTGGRVQNGNRNSAISSTELYDTSTKKWYACDDLPKP